MKRIITLLLVLSAFIGITATAQQPVRWRTTVKATGADEGIVTFRALVSQGFPVKSDRLEKQSRSTTRCLA